MKRICGILIGTMFLLGSTPAWSLETRTVAAGNWHSPSTWSAGVPRAGDTALISHKLTANRNVVCTGAGQWTFRAGSGLTFQGVNEAAFVGGGMDPVATDIGLWIMDRCRLVVAGTPKTAWSRLAGGAAAGATTLTLAAAPTNWRQGDTIIITPTEHPNVGSRAEKGFEQRTIAAIDGARITLNAALAHPHPSNTSPFTGRVFTAEVLNLTRDVVIKGAPGARSHIFIRSAPATPHSIRYAVLQHMGPNNEDQSLLGRYPLHFHHSGEGSRGALVEGVVVHQSGNRAFVPHGSHGVTFRDTIAHDWSMAAYWWDEGTEHQSHDILFDRAVAHFARDVDGRRHHEGFVLGEGRDNEVRDSVSVGNQTKSEAFSWPSKAAGEEFNVWAFNTDNIAHNNRRGGIFVWQNDSNPHVVENFIAYNNGSSQIAHGAYRNCYVYNNIQVFGTKNQNYGLTHHNQTNDDCVMRPDGYVHAFVDYLADAPLEIQSHHQPPQDGPVLFLRCRFTEIILNEGGDPGLYDFVDCVDHNDGATLELGDFVLNEQAPGSRIRVQRPTGTAYQINDQGVVTSIPAFYD